ncbi:MAG: prephenate dehydrogenase [Candidatus Saccharicenans sp.]|uniref:prephenate dehydrogenase n=1 Tax=Candidatus Saccharicenans sp. TaxID=2819258 RepID=UPI0040495F6D
MKYNFLIIGLGQIGGSLALALKKSKTAKKIFGLDCQFKKSYTGILDQYLYDLKTGVSQSDIIILSTPVKEIQTLIKRIAPMMTENQILLDTGSTKSEIVKEMKIFPDRMLIGGHPMTGTVRKEKEAWRPELFSNRPFFICFPHGFSRKGKSIIKDILGRIRAIPIEVDPDRHDFLAANTSHLPYVISLALLKTFLDSRLRDKGIDRFIATGFLGATRLALTSPSVATDILLTNKNYLLLSIEKVIKELTSLSERIEENNFSEIIRSIYLEAERRRKLYENARF